MKARPSPEDIRDILVQNRASALAYADHIGKGQVRSLLAMAEKDLLARIEKVKGGGTFTDAHLRSMLMQVRLVTGQLVDNITGTLSEAADPMSSLAAQGTLDYMTRADEAFRGVGQQPLAFREASMFDSAKMGARSSLLHRLIKSGEPGSEDTAPHPGKLGVMQRYGLNTIGEFEKVLRVGVLTGKSIDEVKGDLTEVSPFLKGKPAWWSERIARTEMMGAYNRASWESQREVNEQLDGEMVKILSATFDQRTAADSYAVHGQIRRPEEAFQTWYGFMQHPPARPNDREIVVPHKISWELPPYLKWRTDDEVATRWQYEGHKEEMPERPEMTTVPLNQFGKEVEKADEESKEPEETEPTAAMRDAMAKGALAEEVGDEALMQQGYAPGEAPIVGTEFEEAEQLADAQAVEMDQATQIDTIMSKLDPSDEGHGYLKHGQAFSSGSFWDGWSEAEQDLISTLSDALVEADETTEVDPHSVILRGDGVSKVDLKYGLKDSLDGLPTTPTVVKKDGLYYQYTGKGSLAAASLLEKEAIDMYVLDLDDSEVQAKFAAAKPTPALTASDIMATKTGAKAGSNEGGFYKGTDDVERYVKAYTDPAQAHCENISNAIYKELGLAAPDSLTFEDAAGKTLYAHETVPGKTLDQAGLNKETAQKILDGYAADVLLGNRDVIGASKDNILIQSDGNVRRLDQGGSLLIRARGSRKPLSDLHVLSEWDGFFNGSINTYASVLDAAGVKTHADMKKQLVKGITDILALTKAQGGWGTFIEKTAPKMKADDRKAVIDMLDARTKLLEEKLKILKKRVTKPKPLTLEPGKWGPSTTSSYDELLARKKPLNEQPQDTPTKTPNGKEAYGPNGYTPGPYRIEAQKAIDNYVSTEQKSSIKKFTGSDYGAIRGASRMTEEEYRKENGSVSGYAEYKLHAERVEAAFDAMPEDERVPGIVFRGISVPRAVANSILAQNDRPHLPGLGAMFSTSRRTGPAHSFLGNGGGDTHIYMVINQKRGVAVETISVNPGEDEVLMSGKTKCRLMDHYVCADVGGYKNVLVLHYEEIVDEAELTGTAPKKKPRKKKETTT